MFLITNINSMDEQLDWPTDKQIAEQIERLNFEDFAILSKDVDGEHYIQTMKDEGVGFVLEFREGSPKEHYEVISDYLDKGTVIEAFRGYLNGHFEAWRANQNIGEVSF